MDNPWIEILLLALVQGVAEFLPISSSGHVVILADLLGRQLDLVDLNIVLHVGTLFSILVYYRRRIWRLMGVDRRAISALVIGTCPAVIVGLPIKKFASDELLANPILAACLLPVTGLILIWAARHRGGRETYQRLGWRGSLMIGISQAAAILPGLSRSGLTISAGLACRLAPDSAAAFAFLLAIPAIGGAGLLEVLSIATSGGVSTPWEQLAVGMVVAFLVGLASIWILERLLVRGRLQTFAWWCIPAGIAYLLYRWLAV